MSAGTVAAACFEVPLKPDAKYSDMSQEIPEASPVCCLTETIDASPAELISLVEQFGFEGVIVNRKDSCYEIGAKRCLA
jgi:hypothetical protein